MELNELQLGDWVYENKEGINGTIFKYQRIIETLQDIEYAKTYEPILINEIVLKNLGFRLEGNYCNDNCWEYYKNSFYRIYLMEHKKFNEPNEYFLCYILDSNNGSDSLQEIGKPMLYVHELQHLIKALVKE